MRRRDFIAALGIAVARPLSASAQQPALPLVGFLSSLCHRSRCRVSPRSGKFGIRRGEKTSPPTR